MIMHVVCRVTRTIGLRTVCGILLTLQYPTHFTYVDIKLMNTIISKLL